MNFWREFRRTVDPWVFAVWVIVMVIMIVVAALR